MTRIAPHWAAGALLAVMAFWSGGAALRESATFDEVAHVGAGLSYWQRLDMRLNPEHPPLGKALAALPLAIRGTRADYSSPEWRLSTEFFQAFAAQWIFGDAVLGRWNGWRATLLWARLPMLLLTLVLGWVIYVYGTRLGGAAGGLLALAAYCTTPAFLTFGPLVITDVPVTLFTLIAVWQLGEIWAAPSRASALRFGAAAAAALLSKFTGALLLPVAVALYLDARFRTGVGQPAKDFERRAWRKQRLRCVARGFLWAAVFTYIVYFLFTWNQPDSALDRVGSGWWAHLARRPLMPPWIYLRGVLLMLVMASRPTFLFGHTISHGVPYYFPVVFALKSTEAFLLLLVLAGAAWLAGRGLGPVIPEAVRPHWRALSVALFTFLAACLLSRLDISIRHFMAPMALGTVMLAPMPRMLARLPRPRLWQAACAALAASCFVPVARAYPHFFPYVNSLALGRPAYQVVNDSNVSWNEALPEIGRFAREHGMREIALDWFAFSDPALVVPEARPWSCEAPAESDGGKWVAVSAVAILETHNCGYLQQYPHQALAGGSFYVFRLPPRLPRAGEPGGPPLPSEYRNTWGMPVDYRAWTLQAERHPEGLSQQMQILMRQFQGNAAADGGTKRGQ